MRNKNTLIIIIVILLAAIAGEASIFTYTYRLMQRKEKEVEEQNSEIVKFLRDAERAQQLYHSNNQKFTEDYVILRSAFPRIAFLPYGSKAQAEKKEVEVVFAEKDRYCMQTKSQHDNTVWRVHIPRRSRIGADAFIEHKACLDYEGYILP